MASYRDEAYRIVARRILNGIDAVVETEETGLQRHTNGAYVSVALWVQDNWINDPDTLQDLCFMPESAFESDEYYRDEDE